MPVRYGGVTYPNVRYGGVNYPNVRYGGVTYPLAVVPSVYSTVTVNLTGYTATATQIRWDDNVALPPTFDDNGANQTLSQVILRSTNAVSISILGTNRRWTPEFEATGRIIFTASDGETLEVMIANADMTEPYAWFPTNGQEITLFVAHVRALADHDATLTLTDEPAVLTVAPAFADSTGDAQAWMQNTAIAPITVPAATGDPVLTYAAIDLPAGIAFDAGTRVISGTPTTAGSGTATVTATNPAGSATWTVAYTIAAALTLRQRLVGVDGGSGNLIDVTLDNPIAGGNADQHYVYEHTPSHGTLNYVFPAAMFAEPTIFWNERPRFNHNGGTGDEYIVALQRGGSSFDITPFLTSLPATWAWYVINVDTEEWVSWQASVVNAGGDGWTIYKGRTAAGGGTLVAGIRGHTGIVDGHDALEWCFQGVTAGSRMLMALINSNTFDPYP